MKTWAITFLLAAVIGGIAGKLLPKGEKSPLYQPIRFLSALILLVILCQPFLKAVSNPSKLQHTTFLEADESIRYDPGRLLLEQSEKSITKRVRKAFPEGTYELSFETDEEGLAITSILVQTSDQALGENISRWLMDNGLAVF